MQKLSHLFALSRNWRRNDSSSSWPLVNRPFPVNGADDPAAIDIMPVPPRQTSAPSDPHIVWQGDRVQIPDPSKPNLRNVGCI
jgi:hypothetical protein